MTASTLPPNPATPTSPYPGDKPAEPVQGAAEKDELSAQVRLTATRDQVRDALMDIAHPPKRSHSSTGIVGKFTDIVPEMPGVTIVLDAAKRWSEQHGDTARAASQVSQNLIAPIARRHPAGSLGVAVVAGAVLYLAKPWRLMLRPKILVGAASRV